jgi:hypothetical protein
MYTGVQYRVQTVRCWPERLGEVALQNVRSEGGVVDSEEGSWTQRRGRGLRGGVVNSEEGNINVR